MSIVFAGTPAFAVPTLRALVEHGDVCAVFTQPDRPAGRGRRPRASAVKKIALELGLQVYEPERFDAQALSVLKTLAPEALLVAAYGLILPPAVLAIPRLGCINVHASLLPRWRGAAPVARAIQAGDRVTGITIMQMDAGLDTGPILAQEELTIDDEEAAGALEERLAQCGARLLVMTLDALVAGAVSPRPQDDAQATYAPKIRPAEAVLDWARPADELRRRIRAFNPRPVAYTRFRGRRLRVFEAAHPQPQAPPGSAVPGTIVATEGTVIDVQTGTGVLPLTRLQLEGSRILSAAEFLHGQHVQPGERLG